jgi:hypothetical protein
MARLYGDTEPLDGPAPARTIQDDLADLERQSEPDFRRRAAGDVDG